MSFSAGVYTLPNPALVPGQTVASIENNNFRNDVAGALNLTMLRNGTSTATANLPMGGFRLTGLGAATTLGDALSYGQAATVSTLTASGAAALNGGITVDSTAFTVADTTGNTSIAGTLAVTGVTTLTANPVLNGGTANGVAYLNGSKVLTTGSALTFDGSKKLSVISSANSELVLDSSAAGTSILTLLNSTGAEPIFGYSGGAASSLRFGSVTGASGAGFSEQMRLTSTGLGIGTSSPGAALDVSKASGTMFLRDGTTGNASLFFTAAGTGYAEIQAAAYGVNFNKDLVLQRQGGNLGLGVTPSAWNSSFKTMQLGGTASIFGRDSTGYDQAGLYSNAMFSSATSDWRYLVTSGASGYTQASGAHYWFTAPSGTAGNAISFTQAMTLDASGNLNLGVNGTALQWSASGNNCYIAGSSGAMSFATGTAGYVERMRIDSSGNLLVNTTTTLALAHQTIACTAGSGAKIPLALQVGVTTDGYTAVSLQNQAGQQGAIIVNTSSVTYSTSSDYRLKENIQPMQNALGVVAQLNPVTYNWKVDGSDGQGFIAHELQAVVPDCVTGEKDAVDKDGKPVYQGIDTSFLVATLTKAIQEQQEQINQLTARVAQLEGN